MDAYLSQRIESCAIFAGFDRGLAAAIFVFVITIVLDQRVLQRLDVKFANLRKPKLPEELPGRIIVKRSWPALRLIPMELDGEQGKECKLKPFEVILVAALGFHDGREGFVHIKLDIMDAGEEVGKAAVRMW